MYRDERWSHKDSTAIPRADAQIKEGTRTESEWLLCWAGQQTKEVEEQQRGDPTSEVSQEGQGSRERR